MNIPTIKTERLTLRPFRETDAEPLFRILATDGVLQYFPSSTPPSIEKAQRIIIAQLNHWEEHGLGWWAVEHPDSDHLIGWNGLQYLPDTDEIEIGYLLARPFWGQGLATEGAHPGLAYGFETLKLPEIIAVVHPENIASQRVIEKLEMNFTGETEYFGMPVFRYILDRETYVLGNRPR